MGPEALPEILLVPRGTFDLEDPWAPPSGCEMVAFRSARDGGPVRLATTVAAWYDSEALSVLFSAADDHVQATHLAHDAPLYEEDVYEVFLAPAASSTTYYELEINPLGTLFDARIDSPDGVRATMHADRSWTCGGLMGAIRVTFESGGGRLVDTLLRIPFASLGIGVPAEGDRWRGNFFRIDRHPVHGNEFSAWRPTLRSPADFHVAAAFGTLEFRR